MKKIGLVGGISWASTLDYYKYINQGVNQRLGGLNSAECIIYSINFADIQNKGWVHSFDLVFNACKNLMASNVDAIALCANTAHLFSDEIQKKIDIPIINIVSATANDVKNKELTKVGLLGTKFTMEMDFYRKKLREHNIETIIPSSDTDRAKIQHIIKNELCKGDVKRESRKLFIQYAQNLIDNGAQGIVLGCTEIPLLIEQEDFDIPIFNTTKIHVNSIVNFILE